MGLSIFYELHLPGQHSADQALLLLEQVRAGLAKSKSFKVGPLIPVSVTPQTYLFARDPITGKNLHVPASSGWSFELGHTALVKPMLFGLCQFPEKHLEKHGIYFTQLEPGWHFHSHGEAAPAKPKSVAKSIKAYASFFQVFELFRAAGLQTLVEDDLGYWPGKRLDKLEQAFGSSHRSDLFDDILQQVFTSPKS